MGPNARSIWDQIQRHQVLILIGARGTGKTKVVSEVREAFEAHGQAPWIDARRIETFEEMVEPLVSSSNSISSEFLPDEIPDSEDTQILFTIENADYLYDYEWLGSAQDRLRALFTDQKIRGKWRLLITGRPRLRGILGGAGSPLANAGVVVPVKPLSKKTISEIYRVDDSKAGFIATQTGGHAELSGRLANFCAQHSDKPWQILEAFVNENRSYIDSVVADHGELGSRIIEAVWKAPGSSVHGDAVSDRFLRKDGYQARSCIEDLAGSGLLVLEGRYLSINRIVSKAVDRELRSEIEMVDPGEHELAAKILFEIENKLRILVASRLCRLDEEWWQVFVPEDVATKAESAKSYDEEVKDLSIDTMHPIFYLDFATLFEVLQQRDLWSKTFAVEFSSKNVQSVSLAQFQQWQIKLSAVRNRVAHNRPVSVADISVLKDFLGLMTQRVN